MKNKNPCFIALLNFLIIGQWHKHTKAPNHHTTTTTNKISCEISSSFVFLLFQFHKKNWRKRKVQKQNFYTNTKCVVVTSSSSSTHVSTRCLQVCVDVTNVHKTFFGFLYTQVGFYWGRTFLCILCFQIILCVFFYIFSCVFIFCFLFHFHFHVFFVVFFVHCTHTRGPFLFFIFVG